MNKAWRSRSVPLKIHKHLLGAEEKVHILRTLKESGSRMDVHHWASVFKRLPATIEKLAKEAGVELLVR